MAAIHASAVADRITVLGHVEDDLLSLLYSNASVFVFPSLCEGFGLPVLEAMACGTPVVSSNRGSLPEVAGDAAVLVDPTNEGDIADAIIRVLTDESTARSLSDKGKTRSSSFTWHRTAELTLGALNALDQ